MKAANIIATVLFITAAILLSYLVITHIPSNYKSWSASSSVNNANTSFKLKDIGKELSNAISPKQKDINVVIFGTPGEGYKAGYLADSIIVASYNFDKNKLYLISIPRDLWVSGENSSFKLNEILIRDDLSLALNLISKITGINLDGYTIVDLNTIKSATNWMGGIDIELEEPAIDWVSGFTLNPGKHHLNGDDAIWLIRNRNNRKGDFFREENQQKIIDALINKFINLPDNRKYEFVNQFVFNSNILKNVSIDFQKITPLILNKQSNSISMKHILLGTETGLTEIRQIKVNKQNSTSSENISVVMPTEGFGKYDQIRKYISKILNSE